jgi:hypothetical protein
MVQAAQIVARCRLVLPVLVLGAGAALAQDAGTRELAVVDPSLHQYDGGPAVSQDFEFFPGDTLFLTFRVDGFSTMEVDDEERFHIAYTVEAFDPSGVPIADTFSGETAAALTFQDKEQEWLPLVRYDTLIPPWAPPGDYRIKIGIEDKLRTQKTQREFTFRLSGREVEPSETLTVRNFHFYRTESSPQPLPNPVYSPGSAIWARFDITGYEFGENNRFHIAYGIEVLRPDGETLFEEPQAAEEQRESFYPQRHIQGGLSLNLTGDLTPGEYTLIVTLSDKIGDQTHTVEEAFEVR